MRKDSLVFTVSLPVYDKHIFKPEEVNKWLYLKPEGCLVLLSAYAFHFPDVDVLGVAAVEARGHHQVSAVEYRDVGGASADVQVGSHAAVHLGEGFRSGAAACDFDLAALAAEHRARGAAVTVALTRESVPLRFGLAVTDAAGDIRGFVEKPDWGRVVSDLVNTGIYVLSPRAMARVPRGVPFDFARDLFPLLLREGEKLAGVVCEGYWCDVGTPASYYRCCADALEGRLRLELPEAFSPPREAAEERRERAAAIRDFPCRDRAATMTALSGLMLEMGADYSDGIRFPLAAGGVHIFPRAARSAVAVAVDAPDAEFAASLALDAGEIIKALDL